MTRQTFTEAVDKFVDASDSWLTDEDAPAVATLQASAEALDKELTSALLAAYGVAYRALLARKPTASATVDPLEALLSGSILDPMTLPDD
jgi:hypothetical protein